MFVEPPLALIEGLRARYAEAHRSYHTWDHIEALLTLFHAHKRRFDDPQRVLWALYWHDAVYDPKAGDNEAQSAQLLRADARAELSDERLSAAASIIEATHKHIVPNNAPSGLRRDMTLFLDMDLSILGQPASVFDAYETAIRSEYAFVDETVYRHARAAILSRFLERDRLYFNDLFADLWEDQARANLRRSITALG